MKNNLFVLSLSVMTMGHVLAEERSNAELLLIAENHASSVLTRSSGESMQLLYRSSSLAVAGAASRGFVVLAVDDAVSPVLGYSDSPFQRGSNPALDWWMETMETSLSGVYTRADVAGMPERPAGLPASVEPYIKTHWAQSTPYNNMCPEYTSGGKTKRYPTGCVATAMAQAMYYYKQPVSGTGKLAYRFNPGDGVLQTNYIDLSQVTFDWDNMLENYKGVAYTEEQATAVATLMNALGASIEMEYTPSGSGAYSTKACNVFRKNFGFGAGVPYHFAPYEIAEEYWAELYKYIALQYPIIYGGATDKGAGHCFILDGYDEDGLLHVNWGWGSNNGDGFFDMKMNGYSVSPDYIPLAPDVFPDYESKLAMLGKGVSAKKRDDTHISVLLSALDAIVNADSETYYGSLYVVARSQATGKDYKLATQEISALRPLYPTSITINKPNISVAGKNFADGTYHLFLATRASKEVDGETVYLEKNYQPIRVTEADCINGYAMEIKDGVIVSVEALNDPLWYHRYASTALETLQAEDSTENNIRYNLYGQPVKDSQPGFVIKNHKTVFIRR